MRRHLGLVVEEHHWGQPFESNFETEDECFRGERRPRYEKGEREVVHASPPDISGQSQFTTT